MTGALAGVVKRRPLFDRLSGCASRGSSEEGTPAWLAPSFPLIRDHAIDVGAHELWSDPAAAPGQVWTGFRFIDIAASDLLFLRSWVAAPGSEHI